MLCRDEGMKTPCAENCGGLSERVQVAGRRGKSWRADGDHSACYRDPEIIPSCLIISPNFSGRL